ncbi:MAG: type 1 glutamine amidotransferase [Bacteriovoracia bacterium]
MRNMMIFQHVAHEPLGTLNPLLKKAGFKIRYLNFGRDGGLKPELEGYNGLIILGGPMGVYEADHYPHLREEMRGIEQALKLGIPILGICLGSQLLAQVLGATARKHERREIGWYEVSLTQEGQADPLFAGCRPREMIFQWHGDTFDVPRDARHLAFTSGCASQAFRYGEKVYGLQFHLEVDQPMIERWLQVPGNQRELAEPGNAYSADQIRQDTERHIARSLELSTEVFSRFMGLFGEFRRQAKLGSSGHGA